MRRTVLAVVPLMLGLTACGGSDGPDARPRPTMPQSTKAPGTCPPGTKGTTIQFDSSGYVRFADLLGDWLAHRSAVVDIKHHSIVELRPEGSPSEIVSWHEITHRHPYGAPVWFVGGAVRCHRPAGESPEAAGSIVTPIVTLHVSHCWIDPVAINGEKWDVAQEDQFGTGGGEPDGFQGQGVAWPGGDVMLYVDKSGATLTLVHANSPWALKRTLCA
ncbi:hypothetical protein [Nocardioides montaniterrae]